MTTVPSTLSENIHSLHMEQSPVDQCPLVYNFLLIPCYLTLIGPATISRSCLMLSLTGLRKKPSQIPTQKILLVTDWSLLTGYSENTIRGRQPSSPMGRDLTKCYTGLPLLGKLKRSYKRSLSKPACVRR